MMITRMNEVAVEALAGTKCGKMLSLQSSDPKVSHDWLPKPLIGIP